MAKKKKKNKNAAFAAGVVALILALIGAFSVVRFAVE